MWDDYVCMFTSLQLDDIYRLIEVKLPFDLFIDDAIFVCLPDEFSIQIVRLFIISKERALHVRQVDMLLLGKKRGKVPSCDLFDALIWHLGRSIQEWSKQNFWKFVFHKFYMIHSQILWPIYTMLHECKKDS